MTTATLSSATPLDVERWIQLDALELALLFVAQLEEDDLVPAVDTESITVSAQPAEGGERFSTDDLFRVVLPEHVDESPVGLTIHARTCLLKARLLRSIVRNVDAIEREAVQMEAVAASHLKDAAGA